MWVLALVNTLGGGNKTVVLLKHFLAVLLGFGRVVGVGDTGLEAADDVGVVFVAGMELVLEDGGTVGFAFGGRVWVVEIGFVA